jgi:hypothetical protein
VVTASSLREIDAGEGPVRALELAYQYEVNGVRYTGSQARLGDADAVADAEERAALYPIGRRTLVSYDPRAPWVAVLEPHDDRQLHILVLGGTVLVVSGLWLIFGV